MTIEKLINILVTITLFEMMVAIGLGVTFAELTAVAKNWKLLVRAALANYMCVPAAALGLLLLFHAQPMVAAGFLILAVCPGAPFAPPCTAIARGNVGISVGLMVMLAGSSAFVAPLLLRVLLPLLSANQPLQIDPTKMVSTLLVTQLLPLCVGLFVRHRRPAMAHRLRKPANLLSTVLSLLTFGVILVVQFPTLRAIRLVSFAGMLALLIASLASGWLLGGPGSGSRKAMALTTSLRNVGLGLVIATRAFAGTPAVTAAIAYGVVEILGSVLLALAWGRRAAAPGACNDSGQALGL